MTNTQATDAGQGVDTTSMSASANEFINRVSQRSPNARKFSEWDDNRVVSEVDDFLGEANAEERERARRLLRRLRDDYKAEMNLLVQEKGVLAHHLAATMKREGWARGERTKLAALVSILQRANPVEKTGHANDKFTVQDFSDAAIYMSDELELARATIATLTARNAELEQKIAYYEAPLPMGENGRYVITCDHRFTDEGTCIRCGEDAEEWDAGCVESIVNDVKDAEAQVAALQQELAQATAWVAAPDGRISESNLWIASAHGDGWFLEFGKNGAKVWFPGVVRLFVDSTQIKMKEGGDDDN